MVLIPVVLSCNRKKENSLTESQIREATDAMVGANRLLLKKDKEEIIHYIDSMNLALKESETGLWFQILKPGSGPKVVEGSEVTLDYTVSLLDGKICYSSDFSGPKQFIAGQGGVENGLDEGVRLLSEGGEAIFILPPHLAHGLMGDGNCIPARSVIVYKIKLTKVQ